MDTRGLSAAYAALLSKAAAGGFAQPPPGRWTAGMLLAHIAVNDALLLNVTRALAAGSVAAYDNASAVADAELRRVADSLGWDGLLSEVRRSADALIEAVRGLTEEQGQRLVSARIVDGGATKVDDTVPWGRLLVVHAQTHLPSLTRQLAALRTA
jgi:hypothetical protein